MGKTTKNGETLLPDRDARREPFERILALPKSEQHDAWLKMRAAHRAHPDHAAKQRIEEHLEAAHMLPELTASPELSNLLFVFREVLHDFVPGETCMEALEPLAAFLSRHPGGGSISKARQEARNLNAVREAFLKLAPSQRDRFATGLVAKVTGLKADAVRGHLATVRAEQQQQLKPD